MNIEILLKKGWDFINGQPPVFRILMLIVVVLFVILPFSLPLAIFYFIRASKKR